MLTGESFQGQPVDIWACGITLYMFIYGRPPYAAKTMTELYGLIQVEPCRSSFVANNLSSPLTASATV
jgi:serine/threonine protein kinase